MGLVAVFVGFFFFVVVVPGDSRNLPHLCGEVISFLDRVNTADAWWGTPGNRTPRAQGAAWLGSGAQVSPGQEATLGPARHGRTGPAGALPPHLLWEMALGAVKSSGESVQLLPSAGTSGFYWVWLFRLFVLF